MKRERWSDEQIACFVSGRKNNFHEIETAESHATWLKIKVDVDNAGPSKIAENKNKKPQRCLQGSKGQQQTVWRIPSVFTIL